MSPFVIRNRKCTLRCGPSAVPFFGASMFLVARSQSVVVTMIEVNTFLATGDCSNVDKVTDALEHKELKKHEWPMAILKPNETLYVPTGFLPLITPGEDLAPVVTVPWFTKAFCSDPASCDNWDFINSGIRKYMSANSEKEPWTTIFPAYKKIFTNTQ